MDLKMPSLVVLASLLSGLTFQQPQSATRSTIETSPQASFAVQAFSPRLTSTISSFWKPHQVSKLLLSLLLLNHPLAFAQQQLLLEDSSSVPATILRVPPAPKVDDRSIKASIDKLEEVIKSIDKKRIKEAFKKHSATQIELFDLWLQRQMRVSTIYESMQQPTWDIVKLRELFQKDPPSFDAHDSSEGTERAGFMEILPSLPDPLFESYLRLCWAMGDLSALRFQLSSENGAISIVALKSDKAMSDYEKSLKKYKIDLALLKGNKILNPKKDFGFIRPPESPQRQESERGDSSVLTGRLPTIVRLIGFVLFGAHLWMHTLYPVVPTTHHASLIQIAA